MHTLCQQYTGCYGDKGKQQTVPVLEALTVSQGVRGGMTDLSNTGGDKLC